MWFNASKAVLDIDGNPYKEQDKPVTLGDVVVTALMRPTIDMRTGRPGEMAETDQISRFGLALRIARGRDDDLPVSIIDKESVLIKETVAKLGVVLLTGRVHEELDKPLPAPPDVSASEERTLP